MDTQLIFIAKAVVLTEALTHAVKSWGILEPARARLSGEIQFFKRLLSCFECVSVWTAAAVFVYLYFLDIQAVTYIIIFQRVATVLHIGVDFVDALRASTLNKL